ncbi:MAG: iron ABC transporter [Desulfobacteraceae bacterium IS3]|nr:MAG: iron ABC transporter [Desulfobacteraceae bacterium IS3]HAO21644.1 ABC transporter ATP-binding protein [Desulfobacteraceae bacterium]
MAIRVENLCFSYGELPILKNITLDISQGKFTVILGRNGSGKSTLLRLIAGLSEPDTGKITILGRDMQKLSLRERAKLIGFLPQQHRPVFPFSVEDMVLTGRASYISLMPKKQDKDKTAEALERVGIIHLKDRAFTELSGGEQQLVMVARVLAQNPEIILLDEPTSHLDLCYQSRLLSLIRELVNQGLTIIAVLHDPNIAFLYGDEFIFLKNGAIQPLENSQKPWDMQVLRHIYDTDFQSVAYGDKNLVIPLTSM